MAKPSSREFKLARNYTLRSILGHTIVFLKDVAVSVPRELEADAMQLGAVPVDGEIAVTDEVENPAKNTGPDDAVARKDEIKSAMRLVVAANQRNDFAASGAPKVPALARVLGYDIDSKERDGIWAELKDEASSDVDES